MKNILIVGSGGRENAFVQYFIRDCDMLNVYLTDTKSNCQLVAQLDSKYIINDGKLETIVKIAKENQIDLVIVGSEKWLADGLADQLKQEQIDVLGVTKNLAKLESSKYFMRKFLETIDLGHLNPKYIYYQKGFKSNQDVIAGVDSLEHIDIKLETFWMHHKGEIVIKKNGLAGGKGVLVSGDHFKDRSEFAGLFGEFNSENNLVIEEKLLGFEFSLISLSDGKNVKHFQPIRDFKRRDNNDFGLNTGGMGSINIIAEENTLKYIKEAESINKKIIKELSDFFGEEYIGFLYGSYILTSDGLKVIEFNVRMGDPEAINAMTSLALEPCVFVESCLKQRLDKTNWGFTNYVSVVKYLVPESYGNGSSHHYSPEVIVPSNDAYQHKVPAFNCDNIHKPMGYYLVSDIRYDQDTKKNFLGSSRSIAFIAEDKDHISAELTVQKMINVFKEANPKVNFHHRIDIGTKTTQWVLSKPKPNLKKSVNDKLYPDLGQPNTGMTYQSSGVDVDNNQKIVSNIKDQIATTYNLNPKKGKVLSELGGFSGVYQLNGKFYKKNPEFACTIDGVGTKSKFLKDEMGVDGLVRAGQEIVDHCVNDLMAAGARPLFMVDYFGAGSVSSRDVEKFIKGCIMSCNREKCAILGGETAEMPDVYKEDVYDLTCTMVGLMDSDLNMTKRKIVPGDIAIGFKSNGPQTNGYTLIRKVIENVRARGDEVPAKVMNQFLAPHESFTHEIDCALKTKLKIKGIIHITGGGLIENPPRIIPDKCYLELQTKNWEIPECYKYIQEETNMSEMELFKTFNCGIGMIVIVSSSWCNYRKLKKLLKKCNVEWKPIGSIKEKTINQQQDVVISNVKKHYI